MEHKEELKNTLIISAFSSSVKSYFFNNIKSKKIILDSNSSKFSLVTDEIKIRNIDFPDKYIAHIKSNIKKADIIFISSHKEVREALRKAQINLLQYIMIYLVKKNTQKDIYKEDQTKASLDL